MWRIGTVIQQYQGDCVEKQEAIRDMLSVYMEQDNTEIPEESLALQSSSLLVFSRSIEIPAVCPPITSLKSFLPQTDLTTTVTENSMGYCFVALSVSQIDVIRQEISILAQDLRLSTVVKGIARSYSSAAGSMPIILFLKLKALYIAKVLHGLDSGLTPANEWRDFSAAWSKYPHVLFAFLVDLALNTLLTRETARI